MSIENSQQPLGIAPVLLANPWVAFIATYWKQLLILAMLGFMVFQHLRIETLKLEKQNLESQIQTSEAVITAKNEEIARLHDNIGSLSDAVKEVSDQSKALNESMKSLQPKVNDIQRKTNTVVQSILNQPAPLSCEESMQFMRRNYTVPWRIDNVTP